MVGSITVWCTDDDLLERAKELGINRSKVFMDALRIVVDHSERSLAVLHDEEETRNQILRIKQRLAEIEEEREALERHLEVLKSHYTELEAQETLIRHEHMISEWFIILNKTITDHAFDYEIIEPLTYELVTKVKEVFPDFNLQEHVERLRERLTS